MTRPTRDIRGRQLANVAPIFVFLESYQYHNHRPCEASKLTIQLRYRHHRHVVGFVL